MLKSRFARLLAITLCFVIAISSLIVPGFVASAQYPSDIPVIYVVGYGSGLSVEQEDGTVETTYNFVNTDLITQTLKDNVDVFLKAFATQDWTEFCDMVVNLMTECYGDFILDGNAQPVKPSYSVWSYDDEYLAERYYFMDEGLYTFVYYYDWRFDPTENMQGLRDFVEAVLKFTGSDKYAICGRCEGACLAVTYCDTFKDDERLSDVILYAGAHLGCKPIGEAFSGQFYFDPDAVERFFNDVQLGINLEVTDGFSFTDDTLMSILRIASDVYGLDMACWAVNNVYEQIAQSVTPESLRNSFGSFPGFWAMCEDKYYEDAKATVFAGVEDEYAVFIDIIDNYHYNYFNRIDEILTETQERGVKVSNIVKYGLQLVPVSEDANMQSDRFCTVEAASIGARTTDIGETFSDDYLRNAVKYGTSKYISPDLCIDASTCLLPDTTWFVKNIAHDVFEREVDALVFSIVKDEIENVFSNENFPQYLYFDEETRLAKPYNVDEDTTRVDEFTEQNSHNFFRKIKPAFRWLYQIFVVIFKILTPRARS